MKTCIIGGGGLVGSCTAYALQCGGVVSGIDLVDVNADLCRGQALDLLHGATLVSDAPVRAVGPEAIREADLICVTAGLRRKPNESRLDLINRNVELFLKILDQVEAARIRPETTVLVVSNPVDVLTYLAVQRLDLAPQQVIGLGTQLDTSRFRGILAQALNLPATQISALILGEHGDSMVPIWSTAQAAGLPIDRFPGWSSQLANDLFTRTKGSGAEVIRLKGGAGFAVGLAIRDVIHAIALDQKRILPVSALVNGPYGIRDVCLSVPTVVGRAGVLDQLEVELWPKEIAALQHSANVLRGTIDQVLSGLGGPIRKTVRPTSGPASATGNGSVSAGHAVTSSNGAPSGGRPRVTVSGGHARS